MFFSCTNIIILSIRASIVKYSYKMDKIIYFYDMRPYFIIFIPLTLHFWAHRIFFSPTAHNSHFRSYRLKNSGRIHFFLFKPTIFHQLHPWKTCAMGEIGKLFGLVIWSSYFENAVLASAIAVQTGINLLQPRHGIAARNITAFREKGQTLFLQLLPQVFGDLRQ